MNILRTDELKRKLKSGAYAPVYFLYGNEAYLINHYTDLITQSVVTALPEINLRTFDSEFDVNEISSILYQVPMLSQKKCVVLNDYDLSTISQSELETIIDVVSNPSDVAVLVFKYTSIEFSLERKNKSQKNNTNFLAVAKALDKAGGMVVNIDHLTMGDTVKTIVSGARRRNCGMSVETARYMVEYCSFDLTSLLCELEKLCSYVGEGEITKEIINKICARSVNAIIYDMAKAILANNADRSMEILDALLNQKVKDINISREIAKSYIDIYRMFAARKANVNVPTVAEDFDYGNRDFVLKNSLPFASKLTANQLELSLNAINEADNMLKGASRLKSADILRMLIVKLVLIATKGELPC